MRDNSRVARGTNSHGFAFGDRAGFGDGVVNADRAGASAGCLVGVAAGAVVGHHPPGLRGHFGKPCCLIDGQRVDVLHAHLADPVGALGGFKVACVREKRIPRSLLHRPLFSGRREQHLGIVHTESDQVAVVAGEAAHLSLPFSVSRAVFAHVVNVLAFFGRHGRRQRHAVLRVRPPRRVGQSTSDVHAVLDDAVAGQAERYTKDGADRHGWCRRESWCAGQQREGQREEQEGQAHGGSGQAGRVRHRDRIGVDHALIATGKQAGGVQNARGAVDGGDCTGSKHQKHALDGAGSGGHGEHWC